MVHEVNKTSATKWAKIACKMQVYGFALFLFVMLFVSAKVDTVMFGMDQLLMVLSVLSMCLSVVVMLVAGFYFSRYKRNYMWLFLAPIPVLGWLLLLAEEQKRAAAAADTKLIAASASLMNWAKILMPIGVFLQAVSFYLDFIPFAFALVVLALAMACYVLSRGRSVLWSVLATLPGIGLIILPHLQDARVQNTALTSDDVCMHDDQKGSFMMKKQWYAWHSFFLFFVFVFLSSAILTSGESVTLEAAVLILLVAYVFLCFLINHTIVKLDVSGLHVTHHYLPLPCKKYQPKHCSLEEILDVKIKQYGQDKSKLWHQLRIMQTVFFPIKRNHQVSVQTESGMHCIIGFSELQYAEALKTSLLSAVYAKTGKPALRHV